MVYDTLDDLAETALRIGQAAIVDVTYLRLEERDAIAAVAARAGVLFLGLWLEAPVEMLVRRVKERRRDASDATGSVVVSQARQTIGILAWHRLDSSQTLDALKAAALDLLQQAVAGRT